MIDYGTDIRLAILEQLAEQGFNMTELARHIDKPQSEVWRVLKDPSRSPGLDYIEPMMHSLGLRVVMIEDDGDE